MADISLTPTFGVWLISVFLESILYGTGVLQVFLYFWWYPNDVLPIKLSVIVLLLVETLQIAISYFGTFTHIIDGFGDTAKLFAIEWADYTQLFFIYLSAAIVQLYFSYCIYKFVSSAKTSKLVVQMVISTIVLLVLLELGAGIAQVIQTSQVNTFAALNTVKDMTSLQSAVAFVVDSMITICLVVVLKEKKGNIKQTNNMLDTLILYAINRGFLTAACALINLVLFLAVPGTFYFFLGLVCSSKLYMNSMLATLNTRSHVQNTSDSRGDAVVWNSMLVTTTQSRSTSVPSVMPIFPSIGSNTVNKGAFELQDRSDKQFFGVRSNANEGQQNMSTSTV